MLTRRSSDLNVSTGVESLLGSSVAELEREDREEEFRFQVVNLGESTAHFCFAMRMLMVLVSVAA